MTTRKWTCVNGDGIWGVKPPHASARRFDQPDQPPHIVSSPVETYIEHWMCPRCDGEMFYAGTTFLTDPSWYEHKCSMCGYRSDSRDVKYPRIIYVEKKDAALSALSNLADAWIEQDEKRPSITDCLKSVIDANRRSDP